MKRLSLLALCFLTAAASAQTKWYYSPALSDPNTLPTGPGTSSPAKFSTFVNNPRSQFANVRFTSMTSFAGSYNPATPTPIHSPTQLNCAWLESPPVSTTLDTNAAMVRLTLDTAGTAYEGAQIYAALAPRTQTDVVLSTVEVAVATTLNGGNIKLIDFFIFSSACAGGTDCNHNGVNDACDIANGTSQDCDHNGVPDE
ncbi:MAG: hypothetical protein HY269_04775, partial [Deltaproteobacteria bacterium]|nr:hypothetical protein [Deltaproteobacteria bacterium]